MLAQRLGSLTFLCNPDYLHCTVWREFTAGLYKFSALERVSAPLTSFNSTRRTDMKTTWRAPISKAPFTLTEQQAARTHDVKYIEELNISHGNIRHLSEILRLCERNFVMLIALIFFLFTICNYKVM